MKPAPTMTHSLARRVLCQRWTVVLAAAALIATGFFGWREWTLRRLWRQGEEALAARRYAEALQHFSAYLAIRPNDAQACLRAARAARRARDYYQASVLCGRAQDLRADAEIVAIERQLVAVQQGDARPVPDLRERAREEDDLALAILEVLIQFDIDTYQLRSAQAGFTEYLRRRPGDLHALLGRGYVWERFLSFADALEDYRAAVAHHPDSAAARSHLAGALLTVGTPREALEQYQWLAQRWPDRVEVRLGLAQSWRRLGDSDQAGAALDAILKDNPENAEALWERGQLAMDQAKPAEAERYLRRAVDTLPFDRRFVFSLYRCLLELGRADDAKSLQARVEKIDADLRRLEQLRDEVMQRPNDAALRCEGGLLFLRNGERAEGLRWLQMALRLDPECRQARLALDEASSKEGP
jgi:tetratricopeptide (TPR) repeat protein